MGSIWGRFGFRFFYSVFVFCITKIRCPVIAQDSRRPDGLRCREMKGGGGGGGDGGEDNEAGWTEKDSRRPLGASRRLPQPLGTTTTYI